MLVKLTQERNPTMAINLNHFENEKINMFYEDALNYNNVTAPSVTIQEGRRKLDNGMEPKVNLTNTRYTLCPARKFQILICFSVIQEGNICNMNAIQLNVYTS